MDPRLFCGELRIVLFVSLNEWNTIGLFRQSVVQLLPDLAFNLGPAVVLRPTISFHGFIYAVIMEKKMLWFPAYSGVEECVIDY